MNSKKIAIPAAIAVIAGLLAFGVTRRVTCPGRDDPLEWLRDTSFLTLELELTRDQGDEIARIHADLTAKLEDCCAHHCALRLRLCEALTGGDYDGAGAILEEMCRAYADSERAAFDHIRQVRAVLSPEQSAQLNSMLRKRLCLPCPVCNEQTKGREAYECLVRRKEEILTQSRKARREESFHLCFAIFASLRDEKYE